MDGVTHNYLWQGDRLVSEQYGTTELEFFYDESGVPYALDYNGTIYYYITNLQGDVIGIVDTSGTIKAKYKYNAWGEDIDTTAAVSNIETINPLRYRGYYYDSETGLYYLQSRYYDPVVCRFINADEFAATGQGFLGYNMFAYCENNPVFSKDYRGELAGALVGGFIGGVIGGITAAMKGDNFWAGAAEGAVSGAVSGLAVDAAVAVVATGGTGAVILAGAIAFGGGFAGSLLGEQADSIVSGNGLAEITIESGKEAAISGVVNIFSFGYGAGFGHATNTLNKSSKLSEILHIIFDDALKFKSDDIITAFTTAHFTTQDTLTKELMHSYERK